MQPMRDFMRDEFKVNLKVWYNIPLEDQHESVDNIIPLVASLDPWVLNSLFQSAVACKSTALAMSLIWRDGSGLASQEKMSLAEAVSVARVDEQH
jgi:chaperone required for assembly of F1-ATPase